MNNTRSIQGKKKKTQDLKYGTQVLLISLGTIIGILTMLAVAVIIFFKDFIF